MTTWRDLFIADSFRKSPGTGRYCTYTKSFAVDYKLELLTNAINASIVSNCISIAGDLERKSAILTLGHVAKASRGHARAANPAYSSDSSSALHEGAQTVWDLPSTWRVRNCDRTRCFPHMKQDMVAPLNDAEARNGEPGAFDL
jgi:hypothetical protein